MQGVGADSNLKEEEEDEQQSPLMVKSVTVPGWKSNMAALAMTAAGTVFLLYITYLAQPGSSLFSWHPVLMTLAFTWLMMEGVAMFSKSGLGFGWLHTTKVMAHWVILVAAAAAHGLGYTAIYFTKEQKSRPHLTTWHGYLGLLTSILLWTQITAGVFAKYPKVVQSYVSLKVLRTTHSLFGCVTFSCGVLSVCLALWSTWFQSNAAAWTFYPALALLVWLLCAVWMRHVKKYVRLGSVGLG